jgi:hypothetical protein
MTSIAIVRNDSVDSEPRFSAVNNTGTVQSVGKSVGEAIDALTSQLSSEEANGMVIVVQSRGDEFFTETQIDRLHELMERSRLSALSSGEQDELEALVNAELMASGRRTAKLLDTLGR